MDYKTKPTSRKILRNNAKIFRQLFGFNETEPFDPLIALEKLPDVFTGCTYQIIDDDEFDRMRPKMRCHFACKTMNAKDTQFTYENQFIQLHIATKMELS